MQKTLALPSNRSFGWTFSAILAVAGAYGVWRGGDMLPWLLAVGALLAILTFLRDAWLTPLNRAWMRLGELMGRVVSPIVLGVIFFGVFTPVGVAMRLFGRDAMARRFEPALRTYWVRREPPGPAEGSFRDMF